MLTEADILAVEKGSVVAPAGCGKTELILKTVAFAETGRFLVLTHTHAGVRALRARMKRLGIPRERTNIDTIAGWALNYSRAFPTSSALPHFLPERAQWKDIYVSATRLLSLSFVQRIIRASYVGVFVDEYQDCTAAQHALICKLAEIIPCRVFGDPLQGIFAFDGGTLKWRGDVEAAFPPIGSLNVPWRWKGRNEQLGTWLLTIREDLLSGRPIDLGKGPLTWNQNTNPNQNSNALRLLASEGRVVVIRKWPDAAHEFARSIGRAYVSMEEVECKDLLAFARDVEVCTGATRATCILTFAKLCMTGIGPHTSAVETALQNGRQPRLAAMTSERRAVAVALSAVAQGESLDAVAIALQAIKLLPGVRIFRRELWQEALNTFSEHREGALHETAWRVRSRSRYVDRKNDPHLISRTLLIKGLEFENALIPNANEFTGNDAAKEFYVAVTRGSHSLTVLSSTATIQFPTPNI